MPETESKPLTCSECGSDDLRAWYPEFTSQTIAVTLDEAGGVTFDYTGCTDMADDAGDNDMYACGGCDRMVETIEELVGRPRPPLIGRTLSEWEVLGMLFPGDDPRPDDSFPSGADFIEAVVAHFGFNGDSFKAYIERRQANEKLIAESAARQRLEYLRSQIQAESISYGEIAELESLAEFIAPGDVELLEWAGVEEHAAESVNG